jgi:hypothetical protein
MLCFMFLFCDVADSWRSPENKREFLNESLCSMLYVEQQTDRIMVKHETISR